MTSNGIFCISLDFELHWGRFDKMPVNDKTRNYFLNTRKAIPEMLDLFSAYDVSVTWAAVGMLFHEDAQQWARYRPSVLPCYANAKLSSYEWVKQNSVIDELHFAPELVDLIMKTPNMEVGTHTYSHYYCNEKGQTVFDFKRDLKTAIEVAALKKIQLKSLVFPRNQMNKEYLSVCAELGIETVRSNPASWYWDETRKETLLTKVARTGDAYMPFGQNHLVKPGSIDVTNSPVLLPASRLYRPWVRNPFLNRLKLQRILSEMTNAARNKLYYHLWWHPHNFGYYPTQCLNELQIILHHYSELNKQYGFKSRSMYDTANYLRTQFKQASA
jgi:hypothetical protein